MKDIPHREFRTWVAWRRDQLNNPSRSDYYMMQIAGYVAHVMSKKRWSIKDFVIKFGERGTSRHLSTEQRTEQSKSVWRARLEKDKSLRSKRGKSKKGS